MATGDVQIKVNDEVYVTSSPMNLDSAGIQVDLLIPPHVAIQSAILTLQAPDDTDTFTLQPTFATNLGQGGLSTSTIQWFTADWLVQRPLTSITIVTGDKPEMFKGRVQLADGPSPWFPPLPVQYVELDCEQRLPGLMASRMMVEIVKVDPDADAWKPASIESIAVSDVVLEAGSRPPDLTVSLDGQSPLFNHTTLLAANQEVTLRNELLSALKAAWPPIDTGGSLRLFIRSSAMGRILWKKLALTTRTTIVNFEYDEQLSTEVRCAVERDVETLVRIPLKYGSAVRSIEMRLASNLRSELPVDNALVPPPTPATSHLLGMDHIAAQSFTVPVGGAQLDAVDLFLRLITERDPSGMGIATGMLAIHPDKNGRPADLPIDGAILPIDLSADSNSSQWVPFVLPKPARLKAGRYWIVVRIDKGHLLWHIGEREAKNGPLPPPETLHQCGRGTWTGFAPTGVAAMVAFAWNRPRFHADKPPSVTQIKVWVCVGVDGERVEATPDATGRIFLDDARLQSPNENAPFYTVVIKTPMAGEITLSKLRVELDPVDSTMGA